MKVLSRKAFMELPSGTLFSKGSQWAFGDFAVKGETSGNDFLALELCNVESFDTGQWLERFEEMLAKGVSYPMEDAYGRDGCFDDKDIFLVFELPDLIRLQAIVCVAIEAGA